MRNNTLDMQEKREARNPARWEWLFVKEEPMAGNSSIIKVPGAPAPRKPRSRRFQSARRRQQVRHIVRMRRRNGPLTVKALEKIITFKR